MSRVSLRRYFIVICTKGECHARKVMHFAAQAQILQLVCKSRSGQNHFKRRKSYNFACFKESDKAHFRGRRSTF